MKKKVVIEKIISVILACIVYFGLCFGTLQSYNPTSWLILVALIILFVKTDFFSKDYLKIRVVLTILFSSILVIGNLFNIYMNSRTINIFSKLFTLGSIKNFLIYLPLIFMILTNIIPLLFKVNLLSKEKYKLSNTKLFFILWLIIFICYIPYLLNFFPGTYSPDSISEFSIVYNNFNGLSDHHPVLHILFMGTFYNIGRLFTNNINIAVSFITIAQMLIMSAILSSSIVFLKNRKVNKYVLLILLLIYALLPVNGYYSIVMWKDTLFAGSLLLLTMMCIKIIETDNERKLNRNELILYILSSLYCIFFRNNAIYMYIIFTLLGLIILKKNKKLLSITSLIIIISFFIIKGPVFNALNIIKSSSSEYIAIPLQQVSRMVYKDVELTDKEEKLINDLIPIETIKRDYTPTVVDSIKFNKDYNREVFDNNKLEYLKLWITLVFKHPVIAIESYGISTLGYYYPGLNYWATANNIYENEYGIEMSTYLPEKVSFLIDKFDSRNIPILAIEWSIGTYIWLLLIFMIVTVKKHGKYYLYPFLPAIGIWLTMMVASPVLGEYRYVYCIILTTPLLILYPYLIKRSK